ncbi:PAS domain S-box protein [Inquilinus sp. CAU 1745]|uniref:sensor histidine kinase n=1 Tax=Inquilinus sp. CAU 1745 TaxID=3140369 RepID=UPI00325BEF6F
MKNRSTEASSPKRGIETKPRDPDIVRPASVQAVGIGASAGDITQMADEARILSEAIVETIRQPLLVLDGHLRVQSANRAFYRQFHVGRQATEGRLVYELGNGQWDIPALRGLLDEVLSKNQTIADFEVEHDFHDIGDRCMLLNATKLVRGGGREILILLAIEDITERRKAEAALRQSEQRLSSRLAAIVESSDDAIVSKNLEGVIASWNRGAERLFGYKGQEIVGKSILTLIPPDRHDEETHILDRIRRGEHIEHYETIRLRKDGSQIWVSLTISPLRDANGKIVGASKIARDMTERRRADVHRRILIRELNHRVKNTLAVIQSIASQTLGHAATIEDARAAFESRLINLAKAHDLLTRENWTGANLADLVSDTVEPLSGGEDRFRIEGPAVQLVPASALAISMALHELSTNAAKYGALSREDGKVELRWKIESNGEAPRLKLRWEESGGPKVVEPKRKGFGSRLIERALAAELGGEVRVSYEPAGVVCTIDAPLPVGNSGGGEWPRGEQYGF